jgi:tetratricopeptide (TPR) repeat protein
MALAQVELWLRHPEPALEAFANAEANSPYRNGAEGLAPKLYAEIAEGRSDAHRMLSHLPQAIAFEQQAVRLDPAVPGRWNKLADMLEATGQPEASQQARKRAQELEFQTGEH